MSKQRLRYNEIIDLLVAINKKMDIRYTVVDAEDDYRADPVGMLRAAEQEVKRQQTIQQ